MAILRYNNTANISTLELNNPNIQARNIARDIATTGCYLNVEESWSVNMESSLGFVVER